MNERNVLHDQLRGRLHGALLGTAVAALAFAGALGAGCDRTNDCGGGVFDATSDCSSSGSNSGNGGNDGNFFNNPEIKFCNNLTYNDGVFAARLKIGVQIITANTGGCSECFKVQTGTGLNWELENFSFGGTIASGTLDIAEDSDDLIFMADIVSAPDTPGVLQYDLGDTACADAEVTFQSLFQGSGLAAGFSQGELTSDFVTDDHALYNFDVN